MEKAGSEEPAFFVMGWLAKPMLSVQLAFEHFEDLGRHSKCSFSNMPVISRP